MLRCYIRSIVAVATTASLIVPLASCATSNASQQASPAVVSQIDTNTDFEFAAIDSYADRPAYARILSVTPNEEVAGEVVRAFEDARWDEDMTEDDGI